jgi:regulatory protein YycI of two-component signal transduction system YycFG
MDWSKAKTILIIALLATNVFLVATYGTMGVKDDPEVLDEVALTQLLAQRGVYLETEIPNQPRDMEVVSVKVVRSMEREVQALLASQGASELFSVKKKIAYEQLLAIENADVASAYVDASVNFITALGFMDESVRFNGISIQGENYVEVEFENLYDGIPLEESHMTCRFTGGEFTELEALWLKPMYNNRKKVAVIDAAVALLALVGEKSPEETWNVKEIQLLYWLDTDEANLEGTVADTAFPAWCITYNQGEKMYFTAAQI